ncbi:D-isomer specific 2-hydroxyacid dehydrogenase family protein [Aurantimonas sp. C2-6-R+9]|uniref:D-isomer specific 2-hydroxyacid dehydrogenase family protein n=1 Tax=unclassified Aurantimonas TaxID=2638230 RepID=UPI002E190BAB|nr:MULTISPECIES: D-isomer specific 2-hydroxyacid dehydrogenase family protein [unclassified Aurantimonas]MEC5293128.1 D-isomer specific 2-hydroxyacid dehydrogenase family protein [Aurantimonas sp. C2-3-R2]MEC5383220.1 D-isomer specific 2-hydroxyacid dehydrogenase family protein [Aurantimonas sp. C2-6-R+9]MEC5414204.1 D-isomer specific 2-hydroxyacid dehydrogenase family protein [Aurantimonas sp. C2-4-R8]
MNVRVALSPGSAEVFAEAVTAGGGVVVPLEDKAEALVCASLTTPNVLRDLLSGAPAVRWVQLPSAGVDRFAAAGVFADKRIKVWTCAKGAYAAPVAEHALALALACLRRLPERARATSWGKQAGVMLGGLDVLIVGGGGIAREILRLLEPFGVRSVVVRRGEGKVSGASRTVTLDQLDVELARADVVFIAAPLTDITKDLMNAGRFAQMKRSAWLVNVARGGIVVTDELEATLREGRIAGAALDVTEPEPLPDGHPLWSRENCLITPHTADTPEITRGLLAARIRENVSRFREGTDLLGTVDVKLGY